MNNNSAVLKSIIRNCCTEVLYIRGVYTNFVKFKLKHLCRSLFFSKFSDLKYVTLLKKKLRHRCFPVNFCEIFKNTFFDRTPPVAASESLLYYHTNVYLVNLGLHYVNLRAGNINSIMRDILDYVRKILHSIPYPIFPFLCLCFWISV